MSYMAFYSTREGLILSRSKVVNNSCYGDPGGHRQGQDRDGGGEGVGETSSCHGNIPQRKIAQHCLPQSLGKRAGLLHPRLGVYLQKKCFASQFYLWIHGQSPALAKFKVHFPQRVQPTDMLRAVRSQKGRY